MKSERRRRKGAGGGELSGQQVIDALNMSLGSKLDSQAAKIDHIALKVESIEAQLADHTKRIMELEKFMADWKSGSIVSPGSRAGSECVVDGASIYGESSGGGRGGSLPPFFRRTELVVGGFQRDSLRDDIISFMKKLTKFGTENATPAIEDYFTPGPKSSVGKIRFTTPGAMWAFIRSNKGVDVLHNSQRIWWTVERSPKERELSKRLSKALALTTEKLLEKSHVSEEKKKIWVGADWGRGEVWIRPDGGRPVTLIKAEDDLSTFLVPTELVTRYADINFEALTNEANAVA